MSKKVNPVGLEICQTFIKAVQNLGFETEMMIQDHAALYRHSRDQSQGEVLSANRLAYGIAQAQASGRADVLAALPAGSEDPKQARALISPLKKAGADELANLVRWKAGLN